jgi:hypothetical protein
LTAFNAFWMSSCESMSPQVASFAPENKRAPDLHDGERHGRLAV